MTRKDQVRFVEDRLGSLPVLLVRDIQAGKLPEEWDGIELRQWSADRAQRCPWLSLRGQRLRDSRTTVLVNNL
jgi:hypothetical protein